MDFVRRRLTVPVHLLFLLSLFLAACGRVLPSEPPTVSPTPQTLVETGASTPEPYPEPLPLVFAGQKIRFENLSLEEGLSQSVVVDILQDDQGFLWFATQEGLNRYDGSQFKVYKNDPQNSNSLAANLVLSMDKDPSGVIWAGTNNGGLNSYDPETGQFTRYLNDPRNSNSLSGNIITAVHVGWDGTVWVGTDTAGLNHLDPRTGAITRYRNDPSDSHSLSSDSISTILEEARGTIWVGTLEGGLNRLDPSTGQFEHYLNNPQDPQSLSSNDVQTLYRDRQGVLWVGTITGGLNRFDPEARKFTRYQNDPNNPQSLSHDWVLSIFEDHWGRFWVGTNGGGINRLDRQTGQFTPIKNDPNDPDSLPNDQVWSIFEDRSGMMWFGTFGSGLAAHDPFKYKFLLIQSDPKSPNSLSNNLVWSIYEDERKTLWIGTNGGGLNRFDPQSGEWRHYQSDPANPNSLSNDIVYYIYEDREGVFWIGTNNGLNRFDPQSETFERVDSPLQILVIYEDHSGRFWLGSTHGLALLDRETNHFTLYSSNPDDPTSIGGNVVTGIIEDPQGNLWVATSTGGLNRFDPQTKEFVRYMNDPADPESISSNTVLSIYPAADGTLWLATFGGLNRFDPRSGKFIAYREKDGLPNDALYGILEDDAGNLWISTNRGLSRFTPGTLAFKNYDVTDGLQSNEFNSGAFFENEDGLMYFGGINGLNAFYPDQVQDNPFLPPIVLTNFEVFHKPVPIGPDSPLKQPIEASQEINLSYTDDFFEFEYAALHFSSPGEIQYAYKMEGLDKDWNYVGNHRFANYTNVPPGEYTFMVKGTNSDHVWNEQGTVLRIVIPPPFWQTWWFRLLMLAGVLGGVFAVFTARIRSVERQREKLELQVQERTRELRETMVELERSKEAAEAANRAKSAFLANMSHEFRTPLNAILGFTQIMTRDEHIRSDQQENLEIIYRSSEHLLGLINDVLEMSKIEAGRATVKKGTFDLYRMLEGLEEMFLLRAESKGTSLKLELSPRVPHYVLTDEGKLRQVLMNLLGNAVKFTEQGHIRLVVHPCSKGSNLSKEETWICFEVEDTGPGIAPQDVEKLFQPFVQATRGQQSQEGTGLGLSISQQYVRLMGGEIQVHSELGKGSLFKFGIPVLVARESDLEKPRPTRRVVGLQPGQPVYRILVVDDQQVNRKLLLQILAPIGFEVREAANGEEALEIWERWAPHLIFMDMRMPVMDGYEATRRVKATIQGQATIIVAITASGLEEDRAVILSEGCDDYIRKPFLEEELFEAIAKHMGVHYLYKEIGPEEAQKPKGPILHREQLPPLPGIGDQDLVARLAAADPEWLDRLERATILGDLEAILQLTRQVAELDVVLAKGIADLANKFEHDRILSMINQSRNLEEHVSS